MLIEYLDEPSDLNSTTSLNDMNYFAKYGFIYDDRENRKISLHPLIREIVALENLPSVSNCHTLLDSLYCICLVHGLERKDRRI